MATVEKIDMSLDDIIKLNKKEQKQSGGARGTRGRGRGGGGARGGRGKRQQAGGADAVKGRGPNKYREFRNSMLGSRGRGGRGRGRGRGQLNRQNSGVSPLNRLGESSETFSTTSTRGGGGVGRRARGRGQRRGLNRPQGGIAGRLGTVSAPQRVPLKDRRQLALNTLLQAKKTLAELNAVKRKIDREKSFNQRRGFNTQTQGRGRGGSQSVRGRGRRGGGLNRNFGSNLTLNRNQGLAQQNRSFGSSLSLNSQGSQRSRRRWRKKSLQSDDSSILTISINNMKGEPSSPQRRKRNRLNRKNLQFNQEPSFQEQIAQLKPAVSQKYTVKKTEFSQVNTGIPLTERFASTTESSNGTVGRKVFF